MTPSDADWIEKLQPSPMHEDADQRWVDPALPDIRSIIKTARDAGYAIGIHGSLRRDVDLMAMPWTDEALEPEELIGLICHRLNARVVGERENKPFGRVSCNIQVGGYVKLIDLSIAPKAHAAHLAKLDTSGQQWEQPHYCESCDYEWIPGEFDKTCKGCGGHGTFGKRPLDTSGLADQIVTYVLSQCVNGYDYDSEPEKAIAFATAALAPLLEELERLKAENRHLQGYRDDFEKRAAWSED